MRGAFRLALVLLLAIPLLMAGLLFLAIDLSASVVGQASFAPEHIERARQLLSHNDPRRMRAGEQRTVVISQQDLALTANYLANRLGHGAGEVALQDGRARVRASIALPLQALQGYVNLDATLSQTATLPRFERLWLGQLPVPAFLCNWLLDQGMSYLRASDDYSALPGVVQQVSTRGGFLMVRFAWSDTVTQQLKAALVGQEEQLRWRVYQQRLAELTNRPDARRVMSLDQLLVPMLELAAQRGGGGRGSAVENRAALIVLAFYVNGRRLSSLVPGAGAWPRARWHIVTLAGRTDFPRHFTISAMIAATAGSPLSNAIGLYKELDDARWASGFSFNDMAANRAGTRLGEIAIANGDSAARLQRELARGLDQADLMPFVRDLPEFLSAAEFQIRFGGVGQPAFGEMMAEIERRIAALPLYR